MGLVFVGDGVSRSELTDRARRISPGFVGCPGFAQRDELARYYALAEAVVLPTHSDPWGLVVNEAMAVILEVNTLRRRIGERRRAGLPALSAALGHQSSRLL